MGYCNNANVIKCYLSVCSKCFTELTHFIINFPGIFLILREELETEARSGEDPVPRHPATKLPGFGCGLALSLPSQEPGCAEERMPGLLWNRDETVRKWSLREESLDVQHRRCVGKSGGIWRALRRAFGLHLCGSRVGLVGVGCGFHHSFSGRMNRSSVSPSHTPVHL